MHDRRMSGRQGGRQEGRYIVWFGRRGRRLTRQIGRGGCRHGTSGGSFHGRDRREKQPRGTPEAIAMGIGHPGGAGSLGQGKIRDIQPRRRGDCMCAKRETEGAGDSVTLHSAAQAVGRRAETLCCRRVQRGSLTSLFSLNPLAASLVRGLSFSLAGRPIAPRGSQSAQGAREREGMAAWSLPPRSASSNCGSWRASRVQTRRLTPASTWCRRM